MVSISKKEEIIRKRLSERFGTNLEKRKVELKDINDTWEADFVSKDGKIVGEVKTAGYKGTPGTAIPRNLCSPYMFLKHAVGAKKRLLVYTEKSLYDHVKTSRCGKLAINDGIDILLEEIDDNEKSKNIS